MFRMVMIPLLVVAGACSGAVDPNVQLIAENIKSNNFEYPINLNN